MNKIVAFEHQLMKSNTIKETTFNLLIFIQDEYIGYYFFDSQRNIFKTETYYIVGDPNEDCLLILLQNIKDSGLKIGKVYFQLDFHELVIVPLAYFDRENIDNYFTLVYGAKQGKELSTLQLKNNQSILIYNLIENIAEVTRVMSAYSNVEIIPSSYSMIDELENYPDYLKVSIRRNGLYLTQFDSDKLIRHNFYSIEYEADYLNVLLQYLKTYNVDSASHYFIIDGYSEMAQILEFRLTSMNFLVHRIHSRELIHLPEDYSYLPIYPFSNSYYSLICVS